MVTPTNISRSFPEVVWEMVMLVRWVLPLEVLSTAGAEPPEGLIGTAPIAQWSSTPRVQDIVTVEAPASVLPAPRVSPDPEGSEIFQRCV
jgi:hypothetical protein